jgi:16S rRNA (uracil1498-N3)-methyltransferase
MIPRLFVADELDAGATIALSPSSTHHLCRVLRRREGERVLVFNGCDGEFGATIVDASQKSATIRLNARTRAQPAETDLRLWFAPLKKDATDFIIEKGTELGVACFQPVATRRAGAERVNLERLRRNAILAAQQSERLSVPVVEPIAALDRLIQGWPENACLLVCAERGAATPIADVLAQLTRDVTPVNRWAIFCGPEGGFEQAELDRIAELPFVSLVGLGPRILRAETAALSALAVFQSIVGDGQRRPPSRS